MSFAIIWRNPHPVRTVRRRRKLIDSATGSIYVMQELIVRVNEQRWAHMATLEVVRGGHAVIGNQVRPAC